jgi:hypothetical protein
VIRSTGPRVARTFLVGCPRSGTTLLQSMLFAHPQVFSCPETFFFVRGVNGTGLRHRIGLASGGVERAFDTLVGLGVTDRRRRGCRLLRREASCARWFTRVMDDAAVAAGARMWVEKTPGHLARIETIRRYVPGARFIHMIREGAPTVASLYDVTQRYPDWDGPRSLEDCARRWSLDISTSAAYAGNPAHAFIAYERLIADPERVLVALCGFLRLELDEDHSVLAAMIEHRAASTAGVRLTAERWKQDVGLGMQNRNTEKLEQLFAAEERTRLRELLAGAEGQRELLPFL